MPDNTQPRTLAGQWEEWRSLIRGDVSSEQLQLLEACFYSGALAATAVYDLNIRRAVYRPGGRAAAQAVAREIKEWEQSISKRYPEKIPVPK